MDNFFSIDTLIEILDFFVIWFIFYKLVIYSKGTRIMPLLRGVVFLIVLRVVSGFIGLSTLNWILDQLINWGPIAIVVIFQPEIRKALESIGKKSYFGNRGVISVTDEEKVISYLDESLTFFKQNRMGSLIVLEQKDDLNSITNSGIQMNADVSSALLINIFIPNTPLHDGAIVIKDNKIKAADVILPLSTDDSLGKDFGTRHRAALGLSEVSDAIIVIVSEETGDISIAYKGDFYDNLSSEEYVTFFEDNIISENIPEDKNKNVVDSFKKLFDEKKNSSKKEETSNLKNNFKSSNGSIGRRMNFNSKRNKKDTKDKK